MFMPQSGVPGYIPESVAVRPAMINQALQQIKRHPVAFIV
jgi:hypothetical protein